MKQPAILLLIILFTSVQVANATIFINQTSSPATQPLIYLGMVGQNFTTPNYTNASIYKLNYVEIKGASSAGTQAIDMTISNSTYTSSNVTVTWSTVVQPWRYNFSNVYLVSNSSKYNFTLSSPYLGAVQVNVYMDGAGNPYAGGNIWVDNLPINAADLTFNLSITPHNTVGNWTFNQGTGNYANDSSGNNFNLTLRNTTWGTSTNNGSVNSSSVSFNGQYSNATNGNGTLLNVSDITMSFWIKTSNSSAGFIFQRYVLSGGFQGYGLMLSRTTPGKFDFYSDTGNWKPNLNPTSIIDSKWHYVVVTGENDTNSGIIYIDGSQVGTFVYSKPTDFNTTLMIGSDIQGLDSINATLDEISLYNYAFNASEVVAEFQKFHATPAYPVANLNITSSASTESVNFSWYDTVYPSDELIIATDSTFTAIVHDAFHSTDFANISLTSNRTYYWKVRQFNSGTGTYGNTSEIQKFTIGKYNGYLNVAVLDELTFKLVPIFNATVYGTGFVKSKSSTTGIVNFTASDIDPGQFTLIITLNSTYGTRALIVNSPGNYTVFVPNAVVNTNDFVSFYLLDYTGRFPYANTNLTITKGVNITQSQFFDSDAKVAANLIRGERYTLTVYNPSTSDMQTWGDYSPSGTGSVQVVISSFSINESVLMPYVQSISRDGNDINFAWNDRNNILNWVNITVYQDNYSYLVYSLNTSVRTGTATFTITNTSALYFAQMNASTTRSDTIDSLIIDLRTGTELIRNLSYGSFSVPAWFKNALAIVLMFMLAGSFGALHRGEGSIITGFIGVYLWYIGWLTMTTAIAALFGSMVMFAIVYHMNTKSKPSYF